MDVLAMMMAARAAPATGTEFGDDFTTGADEWLAGRTATGTNGGFVWNHDLYGANLMPDGFTEVVTAGNVRSRSTTTSGWQYDLYRPPVTLSNVDLYSECVFNGGPIDNVFMGPAISINAEGTNKIGTVYFVCYIGSYRIIQLTAPDNTQGAFLALPNHQFQAGHVCRLEYRAPDANTIWYSPNYPTVAMVSAATVTPMTSLTVGMVSCNGIGPHTSGQTYSAWRGGEV